jgi:hypothetical protein
MASVCLVSRGLRDNMIPLMWETLQLDMGPSYTKRFSTLLDPKSRILPHVRHLIVSSSLSNDDAFDVIADDRAKLLLSALPKDRLTKFHSMEDCSLSLLQVLLLTQRQLERCDAPILYDATNGPHDLDFVDFEMCVTPLVTRLVSLLTFAIVNRELSYASFRYYPIMLERIKALKGLHIDGYSEDDDTVHNLDLSLILPAEPRKPLLKGLTSLHLRQVDLAASPKVLFTHTIVGAIQTLVLNGCDNMCAFLLAMAADGATSVRALNWLEIGLPWDLDDSEESVVAIESLLKACPILSDLDLDVADSRLVSMSAILRHAEGLKNLVLGTGERSEPGIYDVSDMAKLLQRCQVLGSLGINMPRALLGRITDLGMSFRLGPGRSDTEHVQSELESMLVS